MLDTPGVNALIIDDGHLFGSTMRHVIESFGGRTFQVSNVTAAIPVLRKKHFDLVIAQLRSAPGFNLATMIAIKQQTAMPILFIGQRGAPPPDLSVREGVIAITAPFALETLLDSVAQLAARQRAPRSVHIRGS